jgi:hypothetical protein
MEASETYPPIGSNCVGHTTWGLHLADTPSTGCDMTYSPVIGLPALSGQPEAMSLKVSTRVGPILVVAAASLYGGIVKRALGFTAMTTLL